MVAAFPLAKIGLLLMKQLSKPLANLIKNEAKKHPSVRRYVILPVGKAYNWVEMQTLSKRKQFESQLSEDEIIELGSNAVGEIILFGLLTLILLAEYTRQGDKKAIQQKMKEDEFTNLVNTLLETIDEVNRLKKSVKKIEKSFVTPYDAVGMEEVQHVSVQDEDFLDVMLDTSKKKFWRRKKDATEKYEHLTE